MDKPLVVLLLIIGLFLFITMPAHLCPSDTYASRAEAAHLINTGEFGFDYSCKSSPVGEFLVPSKGDYFYENDQKQRFFSKYGVMDTILYLPPLLAQKIWTGNNLEEVSESRSLVFFLNVNNILLALVCVIFLFRLAEYFTERTSTKISFVVLSTITTYTWYFFRAHMHELFQLVFFLGFVYYFIRSIRVSRFEKSARHWKFLRLSLVFAGLLTMTKLLCVLVFLPAWAFTLLAMGPADSWKERLRLNLTSNGLFLCQSLVAPSVVFALIVMLFNYYKTGMFLGTGYEQEYVEGVAAITFSLKYLLESLPGFFLRPGNANLLLHYPLLLVAMLGMTGFFRKWPREAAFLFSVALLFLLVVGSYKFWNGELTYGPRFLILPVVIAALPAIVAIDYLQVNLKKLAVIITGGLLTVILLWSLLMQLFVNSLGFWPDMGQYEVFSTFHDEEIEKYFAKYSHKGILCAEIISYRLGWTWPGYPPLEIVKRKYPEAYKDPYFHKALQIRIMQGYFFLDS